MQQVTSEDHGKGELCECYIVEVRTKKREAANKGYVLGRRV